MLTIDQHDNQHISSPRDSHGENTSRTVGSGIASGTGSQKCECGTIRVHPGAFGSIRGHQGPTGDAGIWKSLDGPDHMFPSRGQDTLCQFAHSQRALPKDHDCARDLSLWLLCETTRGLPPRGY